MKKIVLALACTQLTSCVVYDAYPYYYGSGYSTYNTSTHYYSSAPSYYNHSCYRRPRNVVPLDGTPPPGLHGRVFRGGDGMLYLETR